MKAAWRTRTMPMGYPNLPGRDVSRSVLADAVPRLGVEPGVEAPVRRSGWQGLHVEGVLAIVGLAALWQFASTRFPPMFFPPLQTILATAVDVLGSAEAWRAIGATYLRIVSSLAISFILAAALGVFAAAYRRFEWFITPIVELKQGIPAICWIIFAILWFRDMETRIAFVVITSALPVFFYQTRDATRGIPKDLFDMVRALRPTALQTLRILVVPAMVPSLLTAWRINIGNATRVAIMAELLGGMSGLGNQLRLSQEQFRMDEVAVWTAVLVVFVMLSNALLSWLERRFLGWRAAEGVKYDG